MPTVNDALASMKTVKQEEPISRSRFIDCPFCKTHSLKLKRVVQVGRCKNCNETYKIVIVHVKAGKKKSADSGLAKGSESKADVASELSLPSWQIPSDTSLFGSSVENFSGLSDSDFGYGTGQQEKKSEHESGE